MDLRRATQLGSAIALIALSVLAVVARTVMTPTAGVIAEDPGGQVVHVDPGSPSWRDGIRGGDRVESIESSDGQWILETSRDGAHHVTSDATHRDSLRSTLPWTLLGGVMAGLVAWLAYRRQATAAVLAPMALYLATQPLLMAGAFGVTVAGGAVLFVGSGALLYLSTGRRPWLGLLVIGVALGIAWVITTTVYPSAFDAIDAMRLPFALLCTALAVLAVSDRERAVDFLTERSGPTFVDLAYLGIAVAVAVAAMALGLGAHAPAGQVSRHVGHRLTLPSAGGCRAAG